MKTMRKSQIDVLKVEQNPAEIRKILKKFGYTRMLAIFEFLDNAISALPSRIWIEFKNKCLIIRDNGRGIPSSFIHKLVRLGNENEPNTLLGKNGVGFKTAAISLANSVVVMTKTAGGIVKALVPLFDVSEVHTREPLNRGVEMEEAGKISGYGHGTSIILSDLLLTEDEKQLLEAECMRDVGTYHHHFMLSNKNQNVSIRVGNDMVCGFNPSGRDYRNKRVSKGNSIKPRVLMPMSDICLHDTAVTLKGCRMEATHVPLYKWVQSKDPELAAQLYPDSLKKSSSYGVFFHRAGRLMSIVPFENLGIKDGNMLRGLRVMLYAPADQKFDESMFDSHVSKSVGELSESLKASIHAVLKSSGILDETKRLRRQELDAHNKSTGKRPKVEVAKVIKDFNIICSKLVKMNASWNVPLIRAKRELFKRCSVSV